VLAQARLGRKTLVFKNNTLIALLRMRYALLRYHA
jgi:hypothetical protein